MSSHHFILNKQYGFTLIEMAFVTIIAGLLLSAGASLYGNYLRQKENNITIDNMEDIGEALVDFFGIYGRYPCPADPTLSPEDTDYGVEECRSDPTQPGVGPCPVNLACPNDGASDPPVLIGALPAVTLAENAIYANFQAKKGIDGFGNKYSYAVSELMTDTDFSASNPANNQLGAITVKDENGFDIVNPPDSAHYIVFSHGRTGLGAYTQNGDYLDECVVYDINGNPQTPTPGFDVSSMKVEIENCDGNDSAFVKSLRSEGDNNSYFDDYVFFNASTVTTLWARSAYSPSPTDFYLYNTNIGNVAVGDPTFNIPQATLDVEGIIQAEANAQDAGSGYCNLAGSDCLNPEALAGDIPGMKCGSGEVATGISNNEVDCAPALTGTLNFSCPPLSDGTLQFVTGFSNLGNLECGTP